MCVRSCRTDLGFKGLGFALAERAQTRVGIELGHLLHILLQSK